ncbi:hypothetical protein ABB37_01628 [Leptomonas pyrrhocoris]|uniref:SAM-dependent MTase RsmB/NOP-type domain-containing protein n=1 Tax=Leptomonas pyrrhocoris TaxID=157538 RepID=A0A0M9G957_LEPPY|nr:hypothetical protein ABB37_01628 [Leptomonas pyrrhocoris]KPA85287.1 hypothetical protein ABB37_01628 [Leptomonas pyrrhocoris]|eukprot:XP_015663726.1 hypothetical protein ABB37_01628 [Leptomonas pyrrhocoris]
MDVYRQAAEIIKIVREGNGTAKALCLRKEMQKKKQTYAVVCETLRHYELLEDVLENAEFFKYYPQANREFALCMAYDVVLGKGVNTNNDSTARAVTQSASFLREAYWQVHKHHVIPPRSNEKWEEPEEGGGSNSKKNGNDGASSSSATTGSLRLPRYARVNTLKISVEELVSRLRRSAEARKRARDEGGDEGAVAEPAANKNGEDTGKRTPHRASSKPHRSLPEFTQDPIVPQLLVFPPGTDLHAHPAVRSGQLILQDRASCIPAAVLLDAVTVDVMCGEAEGGEKLAAARKPPEYVVDACAAPGNKTTQLAALGAPDVKIMATERDERRAELLVKRVGTLGAADYVNVVNSDFFLLSSDDRAATEAILLDPSCSASGVMTRVDVAVQHHRTRHPKDEQKGTHDAEKEVAKEYDGDDGDDAAAAAAGSSGAINPETQENNFSMQEERVEKLSRLQRKLLAHSLLSFDGCRTVVYSTCSVHEAENEEVVRQVLDDERVQARGWTLSNIMPKEWKTRGKEKQGDKHPLRYTIRCDPVTDATNGFYVARFDRQLKS